MLSVCSSSGKRREHPAARVAVGCPYSCMHASQALCLTCGAWMPVAVHACKPRLVLDMLQRARTCACKPRRLLLC